MYTRNSASQQASFAHVGFARGRSTALRHVAAAFFLAAALVAAPFSFNAAASAAGRGHEDPAASNSTQGSTKAGDRAPARDGSHGKEQGKAADGRGGPQAGDGQGTPRGGGNAGGGKPPKDGDGPGRGDGKPPKGDGPPGGGNGGGAGSGGGGAGGGNAGGNGPGGGSSGGGNNPGGGNGSGGGSSAPGGGGGSTGPSDPAPTGGGGPTAGSPDAPTVAGSTPLPGTSTGGPALGGTPAGIAAGPANPLIPIAGDVSAGSWSSRDGRGARAAALPRRFVQRLGPAGDRGARSEIRLAVSTDRPVDRAREKVGPESAGAIESIVTRIVETVPPEYRLLVLLLSLTSTILGALVARERRRSARAHRNALKDSLTGLPNREALERRLAREWRRAARYDRPLGLLVMDLDGFKQVNDSCGHAAGDELLCLAAETIARDLRSSDMAARLSGDEFIVLCPETSSEDLDRVAMLLHERLGELPVRVSLGFAERRPGDREAADVLMRADAAMYRDKERSRTSAEAADVHGPLAGEAAAAETA